MITRIAEDAFCLRTEEPQAMIEGRARALRATGLFEDVVPVVGALTVIFDPLKTDETAAKAALDQAPYGLGEAADARRLTVAVHYDGEDVDAVAEKLSLTRAALIDAHTSATYAVQFLGFTPGFAYLGGVPTVLRGLSRLASPRVRVPAGSIGLAGERCGIYALGGPGGWPLIGRTDAALFDPRADDPFTLAPGTTVRFEPAP